jgi:tricorn protease
LKKIIYTLSLFIVALFGAQSLSANWFRYPAISPDGNTIAFSYGGDIYLVSAQGGMARQLTNHVAYDFKPVWSNDGKKIAFASDRFGNFDVFVIAVDGGEATRLTRHSAGDLPTAFSPDDKQVYFTSSRLGEANSVLFPTPILGQLYQVNVSGGQEILSYSWPMHDISFSPDGNLLAYHDRKGYEDEWRKHHTSSVTRDIWIYNKRTAQNTKFEFFKGENRNPVFISESEFYFLSEKSGSFNIWKADLSGVNPTQQITSFEHHPVRFLSSSKRGVLCFGYDGEIYTLSPNGSAQKVNILLSVEPKKNASQLLKVNRANEFSVSPNGKEIAFTYRGEVFVTAVEFGSTKKITNTPVMERSVSFSPCGKKLLYAAERNGSWNIYETTLARDEEKYFFAATILNEKPLVENEEETFQPAYSPDGKEVAYLSNRTEIKVINLKSKAIRTVMSGGFSYSYSDGDQDFAWSPDSKWIVAEYYPNNRWVSELGLFDANQKDKHINLTQSGYSEGNAKWAMNGEALIYFTDKYGYRSHGSWGADRDVVATFLTRKAWELFSLSEEERSLRDEVEKEDEVDDKKDKKDKKKSLDEKEVKSLQFDFNFLDERTERLTIHSSQVVDAYLTKDAEKLFYLTRFEKGFDLWVQDFKKQETKVLAKLGGSPSSIIVDDKEEFAFLLNRGNPVKINLKSGEQKSISIDAEMQLDNLAEKEYIFEHAWRQTRDKFYLEDLHGVDWDFYKKEYKKYLPHITNNYDFAEMLSELLGELNASHTGARYRPYNAKGDQTAHLAIYQDFEYTGKGIKIADVLPKNMVFAVDSKVQPGTIIEKIDGIEIDLQTNYYSLLNRKAGKRVLLNLYNPSNKERWEEVVKPISQGEASNLAYHRWVKKMEDMVAELSGGKVGYVHVRGMNSAAFREIYKNLLGKYNDCESVIVDTRFNGGGWLHDDLATLLSGKTYLTFSPRGQESIGGEPMFKWSKPSAVLMSEGNYSDAHMFPFVYKELGIGKLIGMPVPGTGTAVWWETQIDPDLVFGIPQVGMKDNRGNLLENQTLNPDIEVALPNIEAVEGKDAQIEAAVKLLLGS